LDQIKHNSIFIFCQQFRKDRLGAKITEMYLKSLELTGFKSFAKKGNLQFTTPITAIVGPNGSGKSNVAESFRFVLGEQSLKSLRGKKGEDMIFNGSTEVPRSNKASVKIVFDNKKRFLSIDFDEVSIERAVHRDGVNEYFLNGSKVRLKDILELLAEAHIGPSGHHIISQGEADRILNANIKDRKVMIEDALGLKIFQYKREESERKLVKTEENMKQVESLRKEIIPHIRFLKKQVEKVEKARTLREELQTLYREYLKREHEFIELEKKRVFEGKKEPEERAQQLEKDSAEAKDILLRGAKKDEKSEEIVSLEEKLRLLRTEKQTISRDIGRLEGEIASQERMLTKIVSSVEHSEIKISSKEVEAFVGTLEDKILEAEKAGDIDTMKGVLSHIRDILRGFMQKNTGEEKQDISHEYKVEIENLKKSKVLFEEKIEGISKQEKEVGERYVELQKEIEREKDSNRDAEKAVFRIMAEQNQVHAILKEFAVAEARLKLIEEEFKREVAEGAALIGSTLLQYKEFVLQNENVLSEARHIQEGRKRDIEKTKIRLEEAGGGSAEEIMKEYTEVTEREQFLIKEIEDLEQSKNSLKVLIQDLEEKLNTQFKEGIEKINTQFQDFFALMFGGGHAKLSVIKEKKRKKSTFDGLDEVEAIIDGVPEEEGEEGIDIDVSLPRKKTKGLMMLSGGERALTSIALLFAVSQVNPPPFIILDETDAALDEANSKKYGDMVENLSKHSQLILITHNRETMARAGVIYGVTMGSGGVSKLLSIAFEEAQVVAK
jgi:chromosome segregation protein